MMGFSRPVERWWIYDADAVWVLLLILLLLRRVWLLLILPSIRYSIQKCWYQFSTVLINKLNTIWRRQANSWHIDGAFTGLKWYHITYDVPKRKSAFQEPSRKGKRKQSKTTYIVGNWQQRKIMTTTEHQPWSQWSVKQLLPVAHAAGNFDVWGMSITIIHDFIYRGIDWIALISDGSPGHGWGTCKNNTCTFFIFTTFENCAHIFQNTKWRTRRSQHSQLLSDVFKSSSQSS